MTSCSNGNGKFSLSLAPVKKKGSGLKRAALFDDTETKKTKANHGHDPQGFQSIIGFSSTEGAIPQDAQPKKGPLVIPISKDKDWRQRIQETIASRTTTPASTPSGTSTPLQQQQQQQQQGKVDGSNQGEDGLEKEALMELLHQVSVHSDDRMLERDTSRVIPLTAAASDGDKETQVFKRDMSTLPDEATIEDYEATPVEEFGAAMLRGMGWKDGEVAGKRKEHGLKEPVKVQARPNLLGLGATPFPQELQQKQQQQKKTRK